MRQVVLVVVFAALLAIPRLTLSQELQAPKNVAPEVRHTTEEEPLKVFQPSDRMSPETAARLVAGVIYGTFAIVLVMFLLLAYFHEPSYRSKPYSPTEVVRAEGFVPKRREREHQRERINLDDEQSD